AVNTALKADTYIRSMPSEPDRKQEFNAVEQAEHIIKNLLVEVSPTQPPLDTVEFEETTPSDTLNHQEVSVQIGGGEERTEIHTIEDYLQHERFKYLEKEEAR